MAARAFSPGFNFLTLSRGDVVATMCGRRFVVQFVGAVVMGRALTGFELHCWNNAGECGWAVDAMVAGSC